MTYVGAPPAGSYVPPDPPPVPDPDPLPPGDRPTVTIEVAAADDLQDEIDAAPAGSVLGLEAAAVFDLVGATLHITKSLYIVMRGASIIHSGAQKNVPVLLIDGACGPGGIYDGEIVGTKGDGVMWNVSYEFEHGISMGGAHDWDMDNVSVHNVGGDGLHTDGGANQWADGNHFHDGELYEIGRMGWAITDGAIDCSIHDCTIHHVYYHLWDVEPNDATVAGVRAGAINCSFYANTVGTYPYGDHVVNPSQAAGYAFVGTGSSGGGPLKNCTFRDNTFTAAPMKIELFDNDMDNENVVIQDNVSSVDFVDDADFDQCIKVNGCVGVRVTGNTQPLSGASPFLVLSGCTGTIVTSPNTTP